MTSASRVIVGACRSPGSPGSRAAARPAAVVLHNTDDCQSAVVFQLPALKVDRALTEVRDRGPDGRGSLTAVRLTEFWRRMDEQFGDAYAQSVAKDYVLAGLGGRTIAQALAEGDDAKAIWRAVCAAFSVPERLR